MSALYVMKYVGQIGIGFGSVYIGKGIILGVDVLNGRYEGSYTEVAGRISGTVTLTAPAGGIQLVTGVNIAGGQKVPFTIDWPTNFAGGQQQHLSVAGRQVAVTFEKLGDIP